MRLGLVAIRLLHKSDMMQSSGEYHERMAYSLSNDS